MTTITPFVSWQIIPREFMQMMSEGDAGQRERVMSKMLTMTKFDVAALRDAYTSS